MMVMIVFITTVTADGFGRLFGGIDGYIMATMSSTMTGGVTVC